jgi:hypothetical protein
VDDIIADDGPALQNYVERDEQLHPMFVHIAQVHKL